MLAPMLVGITLLTFLLSHAVPADPVTASLGEQAAADPAVVAAFRREWGLDRTLPEQYGIYLWNLVRGNFGVSISTRQPVWLDLRQTFPATVELAVVAMTASILVGIPLGVLSAVKRDSKHDYAARVGGLIGVSIPSFWLATLLLLFTSRVFGWVPPLNYTPIYEDPIENLSQFILPAISISVFTLAIVMRMVRATMLEVLGQDYVRTARAKGVKRKVVISRHALRNALIPVVTIVGFEVGILMGGSAIVEIIFGLPGVGNTLINAIFNRDYPVVQAATMMLAFVFIFANLAVDLLYGVLDPRISQE
jgi:peptide/nickel transport system permease protein